MLPKRNRIRSGKEIKGIHKTKQFHYTSPLLYIIANNSDQDGKKVAIVCRKELGNAVKRNRIKRKIKAAYLNIRHKIAENVKMVVVPRKEMSVGEAEKEIMKLEEKINEANN